MRGSLDIPRRTFAAAGRVSRCFSVSPGLCLQLLGWRAVLPVLKFVVPAHALAKFMWAPPAERRDDTPNLHGLQYVWRNGGRMLVSPNCLERSLVLYRLLSRAGADPNLVFGVKRTDNVVAGHAWVEMEGRTFPSAEDQSYERLAMFGAHGEAVQTLST